MGHLHCSSGNKAAYTQSSNMGLNAGCAATNSFVFMLVMNKPPKALAMAFLRTVAL